MDVRRARSHEIREERLIIRRRRAVRWRTSGINIRKLTYTRIEMFKTIKPLARIVYNIIDENTVGNVVLLNARFNRPNVVCIVSNIYIYIYIRIESDNQIVMVWVYIFVDLAIRKKIKNNNKVTPCTLYYMYISRNAVLFDVRREIKIRFIMGIYIYICILNIRAHKIELLRWTRRPDFFWRSSNTRLSRASRESHDRGIVGKAMLVSREKHRCKIGGSSFIIAPSRTWRIVVGRRTEKRNVCFEIATRW